MAVSFRTDGVWTALVTPFGKDGKVDTAAFKRLVEFQVNQGITGLVPTGTTGESPTLSWNEHNQIVEQCVMFARKNVGVLAGTGSNCTDEAIEATRHAKEAGASAALVVDCYYNGPSSLELRTEYYEQIADNVSDIPLVPYIIPGRSGTALGAEDLAILHGSMPDRFPAVKQATGDLHRMRQDRALCGPGLAIFSGDDELTMPMMADAGIAAAGVVSVMSNLVPGPLCKMVASFKSGERALATKLVTQLEPLFRLVGCKVHGTRELPNGRVLPVEDKFRNPVPVKTMMAGLGMPVGLCRRPLGKMTKPGVDHCRAALVNIYKHSPEILTPIAEAFDINIPARLSDDSIWAGLTRS